MKDPKIYDKYCSSCGKEKPIGNCKFCYPSNEIHLSPFQKRIVEVIHQKWDKAIMSQKESK